MSARLLNESLLCIAQRGGWFWPRMNSQVLFAPSRSTPTHQNAKWNSCWDRKKYIYIYIRSSQRSDLTDQLIRERCNQLIIAELNSWTFATCRPLLRRWILGKHKSGGFYAGGDLMCWHSQAAMITASYIDACHNEAPEQPATCCWLSRHLLSLQLFFFFFLSLRLFIHVRWSNQNTGELDPTDTAACVMHTWGFFFFFFFEMHFQYARCCHTNRFAKTASKQIKSFAFQMVCLTRAVQHRIDAPSREGKIKSPLV